MNASKPLNISEMFREIEIPPHVVDESAQFSVSFTNLCNEQVTVFWLNHDTEVANGVIEPQSSITIGTYIGHQFFYRLHSNMANDPLNRLQLTKMKGDVTTVEFKDPQYMKQLQEELEQQKREFRAAYKESTGVDWVAFYPRDRPSLHMFDADFVGQTHAVSSNHSFYNCYPSTPQQVDECKESNVLHFEWVIKATSPRVMQLQPRLLSDFEISHLILIASQSLNTSTIGQGANIEVSYTRTSKGAWVQRYSSEIVDNIFRRIADVTRISEAHLWPGFGCEQLQVLKYEKGEQFYPHPDYNTDKNGMRYLTFLMYFNDVEEGGETHWPQANLKVKPTKGHAAAFYSQLPDGNADVKSIHAGLPPTKGIKWAASLWIW
eukprot:260508_1